MEELLKNKWFVIGAIVGFILIFFMGKSWGKSTPPSAVNVDGLVDSGGNFVSSMTDSDIQYLTERIFKDLDGVNWFIGGDHENELWYQVSALSDWDLTRVINYWNKHYYSVNHEKLSEAIDNDYFLDISDVITVLLRKIQRIETIR